MKTDVLVIGGGPAGVFSAREAAKYCDVTLVTCGRIFRPEKAEFVLPSEKYGSAEEILEKTLDAGFGYSYRELVEHFCTVGYNLAKKDVLSGTDDYKALKNVCAMRLEYKKGRITGAYCFDMKDRKWFFISASSVVLAAGGFGRIFADSATRDILYGDAITMAYDVGAVLFDMEFIQFGSGTPRTLGGVLINTCGGASDINGLFACGEAATGIHGAYALDDNFFTEAVVCGRIAGQNAAEYAKNAGDSINTILESEDREAPFDVDKMCEDIRQAAVSGLSCPRCVDRLHPALKITKEIADTAKKYPDSFDAVRIYNGAMAVYIALWAAYSRYHSAGCHIRSDNKLPARPNDIHNHYAVKRFGDVMTGRIQNRRFTWKQILSQVFPK